MKEYLLLFRDQALSASFKLFKRLVPSSLIATLLLTIVAILIITPLMLTAMGFGAFDFAGYESYNKEAQQVLAENMGNTEAIVDYFSSKMLNYNMGLFVLTILIGLLIYSWALTLYFRLSDNEIRLGSPSLMKAIKDSFSSSIFKIIGFMFVFLLLQIAVFIGYGLLFALSAGVSKGLGILVGFVGFFLVLIFLLRFIITIPAIVHGNMGTFEAMRFSLKKINFKRGAIFLLIFILLFIVMIFIILILAFIFGSNKISEPSTGSFLLSQVSGFIVNVLIGTYATAALSSLYFRYSEDSIDDDSTSHIIGEENI